MKKVFCATYEGMDAKLVEVESTLTKGLPSFNIVGMAHLSISESKERVKSALLSNDFSFPPKRITLSLSPSDIRKEGSHFDLSIALMIALNTQEADFGAWCIFGELGLDGTVKENVQLYPLLLSLANQKLLKKVMVPYESLEKVSKIPNVSFFGVRNLAEAIELLKNQDTATVNVAQSEIAYPFYEENKVRYYYAKEYEEDFADVRGQELAKRAALIAAAGFHNIVLQGSPGCGKSMIAKRLSYILPPMSLEEILDTAKLHAMEGIEPCFKPHRNMRSPHHSATLASVFGGGSHRAKIGEVGLSHNGILFLDELPHFSKNVLEALREPMQDAKIRISRVNTKVEYPADFLFVGAMNPCPCGNLLHSSKECRCNELQIQKYKNKLSEPFLERIDLHVVMQNIQSSDTSSYTSSDLHKLVVLAHSRAKKRGQERLNARLKDAEVLKYCILSEEAQSIIERAIQSYGLSLRSIQKMKKVARTIADLESAKNIEKEHILEALSYRRRS